MKRIFTVRNLEAMLCVHLILFRGATIQDCFLLYTYPFEFARLRLAQSDVTSVAI